MFFSVPRFDLCMLVLCSYVRQAFARWSSNDSGQSEANWKWHTLAFVEILQKSCLSCLARKLIFGISNSSDEIEDCWSDSFGGCLECSVMMPMPLQSFSLLGWKGKTVSACRVGKVQVWWQMSKGTPACGHRCTTTNDAASKRKQTLPMDILGASKFSFQKEKE